MSGSDISGIEIIKRIASTIYDAGERFDKGNDIELTNEVWDRANLLSGQSKDVITVEQWVWWDLILPNGSALPDPYLPVVIYASFVIKSKLNRFKKGNFVRTSCLFKLHDHRYFETKSTVYVLIGPGERKKIRYHYAFSIFG